MTPKQKVNAVAMMWWLWMWYILLVGYLYGLSIFLLRDLGVGYSFGVDDWWSQYFCFLPWYRGIWKCWKVKCIWWSVIWICESVLGGSFCCLFPLTIFHSDLYAESLLWQLFWVPCLSTTYLRLWVIYSFIFSSCQLLLLLDTLWFS